MRIPVERTQPARGRLVAPRARQVEARAEERTGAGHDDRAHAIVVRRGGEHSIEVAEELLVERVGRRPIERQEPYAALALINSDRGHAASAHRRVLGGPHGGGQCGVPSPLAA